jgi:rRNA maturation protein Nop10
MYMRRYSFLCIAFALLIVAGCFHDRKPLPDSPVLPTISWKHQHIDYLLGSSCWFGTNREACVCADPPHPTTFNTRPWRRDSHYVSDPARPAHPDVVHPDGSRETIGTPDRFDLPTKHGVYKYTLWAAREERNSVTYHFNIQMKQ